VARAATAVSETNAKGLLVYQQELLADMASEEAEQEYQKGLPAVPKANAAMNEVNRFLAEAQFHAAHAREVLEEARRLPATAAEEAARAIEAEVQREAYAAAEAAGSAPPESKEQRARRVAERVAAAMEPYHLGLLRAQKLAAQALADAQASARGAQAFAARAQQLAASAQTYQADGHAAHAQKAMALARSAMEKASSLRLKARQRYAQAEEADRSLGHYQGAMGAAAARAAETTPVKLAPRLPPLEQ